MTQILTLLPLISEPPFYIKRLSNVFCGWSAPLGFLFLLRFFHFSECRVLLWKAEMAASGRTSLISTLQFLFLHIFLLFPLHFLPFKWLCYSVFFLGVWGEWKWLGSACVFWQRALTKGASQHYLCVLLLACFESPPHNTHKMYFVLYS